MIDPDTVLDLTGIIKVFKTQIHLKELPIQTV